MEYRDAAERIDQLLEETDGIERTARAIQAERPSTFSDQHVREFRNRFQTWYASALLVLPDDMKIEFAKEFEGGHFLPGIQKFIGDAAKPNSLLAQAAMENPEMFAVLYWRYPVETTFEQRFVKLQAMLRQARGRYVMLSTIPDKPIPGFYGGAVGTGLTAADVPPPYPASLSDLHSKIVSVAGKLFEDGHYRQAIFEACIAVNQAVRVESGSTAKVGTALMENAFSVGRPLLKISEDKDEQKGFMWLFTGTMMGLRNPRGHQLATENGMTQDECLEWLGFLSALMRVVDRSEKTIGSKMNDKKVNSINFLTMISSCPPMSSHAGL